MEGTTEPIVAVIGHPIAGNPSQFALERSLHEMNLDWRVVSFDVAPDDVSAALEGFLVTGIVGVLVDPSVAVAAADWYAANQPAANQPAANQPAANQPAENQPAANQPGEKDHIDCFCRDDERHFVASNQRLLWLKDQLHQHGGEKRIRMGELDEVESSSALEEIAGDATAIPPDIDTITSADQILIAGTADEPVDLDIEDWPENDGTTLVVDLTEGHPEAAHLREKGYRVLSAIDLRIGVLQRCLQSWTGEIPSADVIHDAIEEYLAV